MLDSGGRRKRRYGQPPRGVEGTLRGVEGTPETPKVWNVPKTLNSVDVNCAPVRYITETKHKRIAHTGRLKSQGGKLLGGELKLKKNVANRITFKCGELDGLMALFDKWTNPAC